ncbi:hypothetical protein COHA_001152 [Chlorella ohadii]|uniref:Uncharacterized protein n=1 Tax=Chlorella ohadii TaxID=2649997 RepID=A0AAD5DZT1_9CHLO|nr:hypothetical protein COHA_001152 [Chlorella ohadii]
MAAISTAPAAAAIGGAHCRATAAAPRAAAAGPRHQQQRAAVRAQAWQRLQEAVGLREGGTRSGRSGAPSRQPRTAKQAALDFYEYYNTKQISRIVDELIADDCEYEDLVHQEAFVGKQAIGAYFAEVERMVPADVRFCVEDITDGDPRKVGVRWHVEITGEDGQPVEFPFSRGCSFYEVNEEGKIVFARDIVEPSIKPGDAALKGISLIAPLVRKLGPNANPAVLKTLPIASGAMWAFYFGYIGYVMLSTTAPGLPVWQTPPDTWQAVLNESFNFFYVNIGLAELGLNPVPCVAEHPVSEGLFNAVNAWSLMWLPVMLADPLGRRVPNRFPLWLGTQFLTNVFFPIYLAQRLRPDSPEEQQQLAAQGAEPVRLPAYAPAIGALAAAVGAFSLGWAALARPEMAGDLPERWQYLVALVSTSRVDWAFVVDSGLYAVWQAWLLGACGAAPAYRFVPFFGLAAWLITGPREGQEEPRARQEARR